MDVRRPRTSSARGQAVVLLVVDVELEPPELADPEESDDPEELEEVEELDPEDESEPVEARLSVR